MVTYQNRFKKVDPLDLRIIGVDDGAFSPTKKISERALLLAVLCKQSQVQTVRIGTIEVDGTDSGDVLQTLLTRLQYDVIMLSGITFGGFNLVNLSKLARTLGKPIIAISGDKPNNHAVVKALSNHFVDWKIRCRMVRSAGKIYSCKPLRAEPKLYFEVKGTTPELARHIIQGTAIISRLPEPIRIARILARALSPLTLTIQS